MLKRIDIKGGKLTYGQRIDLGELFSGDKTDVEKFTETFRILHDVTPDFSNAKEMKTYVDYYFQIIEGLQFWLEREKLLLDYQPEPEEIAAGIRELSKKMGCYGVIKTLARNYSQDPDDILKWEYGKVFGIVYTDLEELKYQKRLRKQYEKNIKK
jgi:hypothetical protein